MAVGVELVVEVEAVAAFLVDPVHHVAELGREPPRPDDLEVLGPPPWMSDAPPRPIMSMLSWATMESRAPSDAW